jgi:L-fucose isomerase-like protein
MVATGGTEKVILDIWAGRKRIAPAEPLFLIAHPGNNSLPAALEVLARLQQDGAPGRIFYLNGPDDAAGLREIEDALHDIGVRRALQRARIGLVGTPSDWLVASSPDASTIRTAWGPTVVPVEMEEVVKTLGTVSDADLEPHVYEFVAGATEVREPTPADLGEVARLYVALKTLVADHELDALTVRCFDFVQHQKTTGCFGLAQLTDEGIIAGCEGDLISTVGLLWAHELLGLTPWMANPAQLDPARNTLWLAHCTAPRTLVESYRLRSHFESGLGVGIQGALPTGPVTLLRIGGKKMNRLWLAEGEILRSGNAENLCRTQAEIELTRGGTVTDLLRAPLGNHLVLVFGHYLDRLQNWCYGVASHIVTS